MIQTKQEGQYVHIEQTRPDGTQVRLSVKFDDEGVVVDCWNKTDECVGTLAILYNDFADEDDAPPTCILTGAKGEDAEDCTTHAHEGDDDN